MTDAKGNELKINDRIIFTSLDYSFLKNLKGKIIEFRNNSYFDDILVEFDKYYDYFHDGNGQRKGHGYYFFCEPKELTKINNCLKLKIRKLKRLIKK